MSNYSFHTSNPLTKGDLLYVQLVTLFFFLVITFFNINYILIKKIIRKKGKFLCAESNFTTHTSKASYNFDCSLNWLSLILLVWISSFTLWKIVLKWITSKFIPCTLLYGLIKITFCDKIYIFFFFLVYCDNKVLW